MQNCESDQESPSGFPTFDYASEDCDSHNDGCAEAIDLSVTCVTTPAAFVDGNGGTSDEAAMPLNLEATTSTPIPIVIPTRVTPLLAQQGDPTNSRPGPKLNPRVEGRVMPAHNLSISQIL